MRKAIFIFIALILLAACINWIRFCKGEKTDEEQFERNLTFANMYEYIDKDYLFCVRYPSFFKDQSDNNNHRARFVHNGQWATIVLEGYVIQNDGQSIRSGMDSLAKALHATNSKLNKDGFILSGPQYEDGSQMEGYSFYSKFISHRKLWYVYTMVYPNRYKKALTRLFKEIDNWQIWAQPKKVLKQGESQTPGARRKTKKD